MKNWKFTLVVSLIGVASLAQSQSINWGPAYTDMADMSIDNSIRGSDSKGFYVTAKVYPHKSIPDYLPSIVLQKYDYTGTRLFSEKLQVNDPEDNKACSDDRVLFMRDNMILSVYATNNSTNRLYKVDANGNIDKKGIDVGDVPAQHKAIKGYLPVDVYNYTVSADKTTLLAYFVKDKSDQVSYKIIKEDLTVVKSGSASFPLPEDFTIEKTAVTATKAYFLTLDKKGKQYTLVTIDKNGSVKTMQLSPDGVSDDIPSVIPSEEFKVDSLGNILFTGFYLGNAKGLSLNPEGPVGYFTMKIDGVSGKVTLNKSAEFDKDLLLKYHQEKKIEQGIGGYYGTLNVRDVIEYPDKSQLIIAEVRQAGSNTSQISGYAGGPATAGTAMGPGSYNYSATTVYYTYGDIMLFKINPDGSQAWYKFYAKRQENDKDKEAADHIFSFGYSITGNTMSIIYNDADKNTSMSTEDMANKEDDVKKAKFGSLELMLQPVDLTNSSNMERKLLGHQYTGDDEKSSVYSPMCYQVGDKIIVFKYNTKKDAGQFGQLILE